MAHVFDYRMRPANPQIFFAATGGAGPADILVEPQPAADDRGIPAPAGNLPGHPAGGRDRRHLALLVQAMQLMVPCGGCDATWYAQPASPRRNPDTRASTPPSCRAFPQAYPPLVCLLGGGASILDSQFVCPLLSRISRFHMRYARRDLLGEQIFFRDIPRSWRNSAAPAPTSIM